MNDRTIAFLTSAHTPFDDRIFYHQAKSLPTKFKAVIVASTANFKTVNDPIAIISENGEIWEKRQKIKFFFEALSQFKPQLVVCSEPLPILAAAKYRRKTKAKVSIIYDVTEWYPSKKNLEGLPFPEKVITFLKLLFFNLYSAAFCSGFIFGEYYKSLPFRLFFPFKKWEMVSYYPDLKYINYQESKLVPDKICLGYTGKISVEKGIGSVFEVAKAVKRKRPQTAVKLKIIGWCLNQAEKNTFEKLCREAENIELEVLGRQEFESFSDQLHEIDILFDLRKPDFENNHCLAIKLFYYAACGKPVIYTGTKANKRVIDVNKFGYFVRPTDTEVIAGHVVNYLKHPDLYQQHSREARKLAGENYNWGIIKPRFVDFIARMLPETVGLG